VEKRLHNRISVPVWGKEVNLTESKALMIVLILYVTLYYIIINLISI
jgi:hypothetical protein